ncbi:MAG: marine proteobacterial sortase target protein [Pseudomonadales bacterium]|nr:marine proteobacterial sortase target protein [Pseudomonadales bacterium]
MLANSKDMLGAVFFLVLLIWAQGICAETFGGANGELMLRSQGGKAVAAPLLRSEVDIDVGGLLARVVVTQYFKNTTDIWMNGEYQFPLPERAAVDRLVMTVGERRIVGEIKEKQVAKKMFEQARRAGKRASLVSQQRPNLFTNNIANIGPGETISVEIHYLETLDYQNGEFSLRLPTTITPRYIPARSREVIQGSELNEEDESELNTVASDVSVAGTIDKNTGWLSSTVQEEDHLSIFPPMTNTGNSQTMRLQMRIDAGFPLEYVHSLYHPVQVSNTDTLYQLQFVDREIPMNRDVVFRWKPRVFGGIGAALFKQEMAGHDYHLLMLLPNIETLSQTAQEVLPRELIFVLDTSGSMSGESIRQARAALIQGLEHLKPGDRFNVIEFNDQASQLYPSAVDFDLHYIEKAKHYIKNLNANGGTNIAGALDLALMHDASEGYVRQIVFITDGSVGNEEDLFIRIHQNLRENRLFTVGIGSAPNRYFMRVAAEIGRGSFTHIGDVGEVEKQMSDLFRKLESPVLAGLKLDWGGADVDVFPKRAPDIYAGEPLVLYLRSDSGALKGSLRVEGNRVGERWQKTLLLDIAKNQDGVAKQWARHKIHEIMSPQNKTAAEDKKQNVLTLALKHQLLSRYTSFIAIEETVTRPRDQKSQSIKIPNAMPKGNTMAMPQTATSSVFNLIVGSIFLILGSLMFSFLMWRSEPR